MVMSGQCALPANCRFMHLAAFFTCFTRLTAGSTDKKTHGSKAPAATGKGGGQEGGDTAAPADPAGGREDLTPSPYAVISSTMGMETFHFVIATWLGQVDIPAKSDLKDWPLQVCTGGGGGGHRTQAISTGLA